MKITLSVVLLHICMLLSLRHFSSPPPPKKTPLKVRSLVLVEQPKKNAGSAKQVTEKPKTSSTAVAIAKKSPPTPPLKKETPQPPLSKPAATKTSKKPTVQKQEIHNKSLPDQQKLLSLMQESINALNDSSASEIAPIQKKNLGKLASETLGFEARYEAELARILEREISLPEEGNVKLKLTLKREGNVEKIVILESKSEKNNIYLTSTLKPYQFPSFGDSFKGEKTHTFTLTLIGENSR